MKKNIILSLIWLVVFNNNVNAQIQDKHLIENIRTYNQICFQLQNRINLLSDVDTINVTKTDNGRSLKVTLNVSTDSLSVWHNKKNNIFEIIIDYLRNYELLRLCKDVNVTVSTQYHYFTDLPILEYRNYIQIPFLLYHQISYESDILNDNDYKYSYPNVEFYTTNNGKIFFYSIFPIYENLSKYCNIKFSNIKIEKYHYDSLFYDVTPPKATIKIDLVFVDIFDLLFRYVDGRKVCKTGYEKL